MAEHGTYRSYKLGCRKKCCRDANARHVAAKRAGQRDPGDALVPADDARQHIAHLMETKVSGGTVLADTVARAVGLSDSYVLRLIGRRRGVALPVRIKVIVHTRIMATTSGDVIAALARRDQSGTARRLHAVMWQGHEVAEVSRVTGVGTTTLWSVARGENSYVSSETHRQVAEYYDLYWATLGCKGSQLRFRRQAAIEAGWLPPEAWQGRDIDDPEAEPDPEVVRQLAALDTATVSACAMYHACGVQRRLWALLWQGHTIMEVARRTGVSNPTLYKVLNGHVSVVHARTYVLVKEYFDHFALKPALTGQKLRARRRRAEEKGWYPPGAWGSSIDDPRAEPDEAVVWYV